MINRNYNNYNKKKMINITFQCVKYAEMSISNVNVIATLALHCKLKKNNNNSIVNNIKQFKQQIIQLGMNELKEVML